MGRARKPLIEIIAALGIVVTLPTVYVGFFAHSPRDPNRYRIRIARWQLAGFKRGLQKFRSGCDRYPTQQEGLGALVQNDGSDCWRGPYVATVPLDPWGTAYEYLYSTERPEVRSLGADGKPGGRYFDGDLSTATVSLELIPPSPYEVRAARLFVIVWVSAFLALLGCVYTLVRRRE